jgi:hypothetical protein
MHFIKTQYVLRQFHLFDLSAVLRKLEASREPVNWESLRFARLSAVFLLASTLPVNGRVYSFSETLRNVSFKINIYIFATANNNFEYFKESLSTSAFCLFPCPTYVTRHAWCHTDICANN